MEPAGNSVLNLQMESKHEEKEVTFPIGPENPRVKCIKIFLSSRSPAFKTIMFSASWTPREGNNSGALEIKVVRF